MTNYFLHHGSPGVPNDFVELIEGLKKEIPGAHFYKVSRIKKIPNHHELPDIKLPSTHIGYSFGCYRALKDASLDLQTKNIILIAPYLFGAKAPSGAMKTILGVSPLKNYLLPLLAKKSIEKLVVESSHPLAPTNEYKKVALNYLDPDVLANSILEKEIKNDEVIKLLELIEKREINIHVIYGEEDLTSITDGKVAIQLSPLKKFKNVKFYPLQNAGHALPWTHIPSIAELVKKISGSKMNKKLGYYENKDIHNNVASFLKKHCQENPNHNILSWVNPQSLKNWDGKKETLLAHDSIKVAELDGLVSVLATEFKKLGIKEGDRVILFLPMSLYMYASMFALQKMGAIPTFLDSWARRDQMGVSAQVAKPSAMISADKAFMYLNDVPEIAQIKIKVVAGEVTSTIAYNAKLEELIQAKTPSEIAAIEKEHTALITFTTGSSGTPKGADRSHRFLAAQHYALNRHLPYKKDDKDLPVFPIFSLNNLAAGVETIIPAIDVGAPKETDALVLYTQMKSAGVTCTTLSPSLFNGLSKFCLEQNLKLDFLRRIVTGGAPISRDDIKNMKAVASNAEILVLYGSTEVEPMAHIEAVEMLKESDNIDPEIVEAGVNVGHLDEGLKYKFIKINKDPVYVTQKADWNLIEVPAGEVGELIVAGEHVCERYFNNEEAFYRAKIKDETGTVWHRTGDLGRLDESSHLWIVGRVHNAINRKGKYFFPVRAEIILKKFPFVHKAAFLGVKDEALTEKTYAVFSSLDKNLNIEEAKAEIKRVFEKNDFIVDEIVHVEDIPMDPRHHSKVEYEALRRKILGN